MSRRHTVVGQQAEGRGFGGEGTLHRRLSEPIVPGALLPPPIIFESKCCQTSCQTKMEANFTLNPSEIRGFTHVPYSGTL